MQLEAWEAVSTVGGAIGGAVTIALLVARPLRKILKQNEEFREDWYGTPARPGRDAIPGVPERLSKIEAELRPNHGSSFRDVVNRMEDRQVRDEQRLTDHLAAHVVIGQTFPPSQPPNG